MLYTFSNTLSLRIEHLILKEMVQKNGKKYFDLYYVHARQNVFYYYFEVICKLQNIHLPSKRLGQSYEQLIVTP